MNKNPDKWIRKEVSERINNIIVNGKTIPCVDTNYTGATQPMHYVAMSTQTKQEEDLNKCDDQWDCTILLDIITRYIGTGNTGSRVLLNDIEERVISLMNNFAIEGGFRVNGKVTVSPSNSMDGHDENEVYFRQLLRYRIKLIEE